MAITASIVVQFGASEGSSEVLQAEVDPRKPSEGGLNPDRSFRPGDTISILIYKTAGVTNLQVQSSAVPVTANGSSSRNIEEQVQFPNEDEGSVGYPINTLNSFSWYGNNLGTLTKVDTKKVGLASAGIGVAKVNYNALYDVYRFTAPASLNGETNFPILIVVSGDAP
jgi:hypothetical protein